MKYIRFFSDISIEQVAEVGGKNASLGEMYQTLASSGVNVPNGFATTSKAYWLFIEHNNLTDPIYNALDNLDISDITALTTTGANIRQLIMHGTVPEELRDQITLAYKKLEQEYGHNVDVAVRSSATAEDLPNASFAGQQETYLNISGIDSVLLACKRVLASLFTDRAIAYRVHQGFSHREVALSIGIQKMIRSDMGSSGVMFTIDTESGFRDVVFITSAYGLGENIVQGKVNPDEFYIHKPTLEKDFRPVIKRQLGDKAIKMIYTGDSLAGISTKNVRVKREQREQFSISDDDALELAQYAITIEKHYSSRAGHFQPMDIEWAKDGVNNKLYILQARPETVHAGKDITIQETYSLKSSGEIILSGKSIGNKIASGKTRVILEAAQMDELEDGEILVTDITDPDWEPVMKRAAAIITNRGGRTCHAAIIARELGIPAVVGCEQATHTLSSNQSVTVSCAEGDTGFIYDGILDFDKTINNLVLKGTPQTKMMLNVGNPESAFTAAQFPCAGVGLARLEFIISSTIKIHPMAILKHGSLPMDEQNRIDSICAGYADPQHFYINRLAEGVGTIAAAFYPRPVIVRMSDFKSNEYASLIGGSHFEPEEENPMIGFRGAGRYSSDKFNEAFKMECKAIKQVRETMGLDNVSIMLPFVRTIKEATSTLDIMVKQGLQRGKNGLKIYLMCEIPANALLADDFLKYFDGFSIGSNDLTQLTLGVDRDSGTIKGFDERNPAVLQLMKLAIDACHRQNKYIGICGQAPSDYPEITRWLVQNKISSISLNLDSLLEMTQVVLDMEADLSTQTSA
ncbi:MAG: phosphoenolpyruvate synthase [Gammaproteobacteria bacterium]|nr:phosphoenolpyruvate synthase [Gammaproteobacteria bacterium]